MLLPKRCLGIATSMSGKWWQGFHGLLVTETTEAGQAILIKDSILPYLFEIKTSTKRRAHCGARRHRGPRLCVYLKKKMTNEGMFSEVSLFFRSTPLTTIRF
jgi:hypothetical protein